MHVNCLGAFKNADSGSVHMKTVQDSASLKRSQVMLMLLIFGPIFEQQVPFSPRVLSFLSVLSFCVLGYFSCSFLLENLFPYALHMGFFLFCEYQLKIGFLKKPL